MRLIHAAKRAAVASAPIVPEANAVASKARRESGSAFGLPVKNRLD
jgi:hypothetical protein